jgi:3-dehydroquinate synthase
MHPVFVGSVTAGLNDFLSARLFSQVVVLVDRNTERDCLPIIESALEAYSPKIISIPSGEIHKQIATCQIIWEKMLAYKLDRNALLINLGGGVIGDMGGFCASTFKRGIAFVQIPTTLLSMVDASVGGKLGIDFGEVKNSLGVFKDPDGVWIDPQFLVTLPPREIRSGFAEMMKHALIADRNQWKVYKSTPTNQFSDWNEKIEQSVNIKKQVVLNDPHEKSIRKILNFGHTIGHAIESMFLTTEDYLLHGEAIAIGMICEAYLSHKYSTLTQAELAEITAMINHHFSHRVIPESTFEHIIDFMSNDKKNQHGQILFALLENIGKATFDVAVSPADILESIAYYNHHKASI